VAFALALVFTKTLALVQLMMGFSICSQSIPSITFSIPMSVIRKESFLFLSPIIVSRSTMVLISPAMFPELSMLYKDIGEGRVIVFILCSFTKLQCANEEEVPESIMAFTEIFLEYPWNMIGILSVKGSPS
jgi:hypothetical protein